MTAYLHHLACQNDPCTCRQIVKACEVCGKSMTIPRWWTRSGRGKCCSQNCRQVRRNTLVRQSITLEAIAARTRISAAGCWEWTGIISSEGYARINTAYVHRLACEKANGPIPPGYQVDHLCRNRRCVNPAHLQAVTPRTNVLRSTAAWVYQTGRCMNGHDMALHGALTSLRSQKMYCKECRRIHQREAYARQEWPSMIRKRKGGVA